MTVGIPEDLRQAALAELDKCNKCGFCLTSCPTYLASGIEWEVARGRLALVRAALEGLLDPRDLPDPVWSCILCRNCKPHCPPGVEMDKVMVALRAALAASLGVSRVRNAVMRGILPSRERLEALAVAGRAAQGLGLDRLLAFAPDARARAALEMAPRLHSPRALRHRLDREGLFAGGNRARVGVFLGCATELGLPGVTVALGRLLRELGIEAALLEGSCCGLPAYSWGDLEGARMAARANLEALSAYERVITPCASCASFLSEYGSLFAAGGAEAAAAAGVASRVEPASVFLAAAGLPEALASSAKSESPPHTFHYPCHLVHYLGFRDELRQLLDAIPGGRYVEMAEADSCCGAGGSYAFTHPDHAAAVLERKMEHVRASGAEVLTTACPACLLQLARGSRRDGGRVGVRHVLELAAGCLLGDEDDHG